MKRISSALLFLMLFLTSIHSQNVISSACWTGEINVGQSKLRIIFNIAVQTDGLQRSTMDVPAQGAKDIPVSILKNNIDSLSLTIPALRASYSGRKVSQTNIQGIFTQNGMALPLNLKLGKAEDIERQQTPKPPFPYVTEEVVFNNTAEGAELSGTLTYPVNYGKMPKASVPVVLMVTGSGSQDRNEEIFGHKPFMVIADHLARNGIASLRYDDRGVGKSSGPLKGLTTENYLADAEAGISFLRGLKKFDKVGILGHSEGGTIAFMMGSKKGIDFLVSLAGSATAGIDLIIDQNRAIMLLQGVSAQIINHYTRALRIIYQDRIKGKTVTDGAKYIDNLCKAESLNLPSNLKTNLVKCITFGDEWMTWFLAYNPADAISRISCPVMALNGSLDMQVLSNENLSVIRQNLPSNNKNYIKEYTSLNHLFQNCTPTTAMNYAAIEETISTEVLSDIAKWIKSVSEL